MGPSEFTQVERLSRGIAAGAADLSSRTDSQSCSLVQTGASMAQINAAVGDSATAAAAGVARAAEAAGIAQRSHGSLQAVVETMDSIAESARRIGEIVHVIEGVAFQTNNLALNAAVEAARACANPWSLDTRPTGLENPRHAHPPTRARGAPPRAAVVRPRNRHP